MQEQISKQKQSKFQSNKLIFFNRNFSKTHQIQAIVKEQFALPILKIYLHKIQDNLEVIEQLLID